MPRSQVLIAWLLLAPALQAQITYSAGNAGNPPVAPSPTAQGWAEALSGACSVAGVSPDPDAPLNAWQVTDPGAGRVLYSQTFWPPQSYQAEIVMRPVAGELYLEIDAGENIMDNVFFVALRLVGQDVHVVELNSGTSLVCPGGADGYHAYNFLSGYAQDVAWVSYDGVVLGTIPYSAWGLGAIGRGLRWGTQDAASGRGRVQRAWMGASEPCSFKTWTYCAAKINSQGCTPAVNWTGGPSASHATAFRITAAQVLNNTVGILIYGTAGAQEQPFQGGLLCVKPPVTRTPGQASGGNPPPSDCSGTFTFEFNDHIASGVDPALTSGKVVWTQYWYRDVPASFGSGLSDGLRFQICP